MKQIKNKTTQQLLSDYIYEMCWDCDNDDWWYQWTSYPWTKEEETTTIQLGHKYIVNFK